MTTSIWTAFWYFAYEFPIPAEIPLWAFCQGELIAPGLKEREIVVEFSDRRMSSMRKTSLSAKRLSGTWRISFGSPSAINKFNTRVKIHQSTLFKSAVDWTWNNQWIYYYLSVKQVRQIKLIVNFDSEMRSG